MIYLNLVPSPGNKLKTVARNCVQKLAQTVLFFLPDLPRSVAFATTANTVRDLKKKNSGDYSHRGFKRELAKSDPSHNLKRNLGWVLIPEASTLSPFVLFVCNKKYSFTFLAWLVSVQSSNCFSTHSESDPSAKKSFKRAGQKAAFWKKFKGYALSFVFFLWQLSPLTVLKN